jgi:hypothetical protein
MGKTQAQRFLISNFRRVLNALCFLLVNSPAPEFYMPTFRNTLPVPSSQADRHEGYNKAKKLFSELKFTAFFFRKKEPSQIYFDLQKDFFRYLNFNLKSIVIIR